GLWGAPRLREFDRVGGPLCPDPPEVWVGDPTDLLLDNHQDYVRSGCDFAWPASHVHYLKPAGRLREGAGDGHARGRSARRAEHDADGPVGCKLHEVSEDDPGELCR